MTPREFAERYGEPGTKRKILSVNFATVAERHLDRYLLIFWWGSGISVTLVPDDPAFPTAFATVSPAVPFIITHKLHGSLVNSAWKVKATVGTPDIYITEAYMRETSLITPERGSFLHAGEQELFQGGWGDVNRLAWTEPTPSFADVLRTLHIDSDSRRR